jgi:hypothetical protein
MARYNNAFGTKGGNSDGSADEAEPRVSGVRQRDYTFRSRKQIEATPEQEAMLETKYRCKVWGEEWKEKTVGVLPKTPPK